MTRKSLKFIDDFHAIVTIHDGPAAGDYPTNIDALATPQRPTEDGLVFLGWPKVLGKKVRLLTRVAELEGVDQIPARRAAHAATLAATPHECDRCHKDFPRAQATWRPVRIGAIKTKLPYCPDCARVLWETEDGFGDAGPGSVEPGDATGYHKGDAGEFGDE